MSVVKLRASASRLKGRKAEGDAREVSGTSVASQWQTWLHFGSSREGASGSVRATVSWMPERGWMGSSSGEEGEGTVSRKWTRGCFLAFLGLMSLPISADAFFQSAVMVRRGVKGSRTVGIMLALRSLLWKRD